MTRFWVGSNDVGPHGFSGITDTYAENLDEAKRWAKARFHDFPVDPRRRDKTLRLAVVPWDRSLELPGGTSPGGLLVEPEYIVEITR